MDRLDIYFASLAAITLHPGFQREGTYIYTLRECYLLAKEMEAIRDADSSSGDNGWSRDRREFCAEFSEPEADAEADRFSRRDVQHGGATPDEGHGSSGN